MSSKPTAEEVYRTFRTWRNLPTTEKEAREQLRRFYGLGEDSDA